MVFNRTMVNLIYGSGFNMVIWLHQRLYAIGDMGIAMAMVVTIGYSLNR